jgi:hypothetical protein
LMTGILWGVSGALLSLMIRKSYSSTWFLSSAWIASHDCQKTLGPDFQCSVSIPYIYISHHSATQANEI